MDRLKAQRAVRLRQIKIIIKEATATHSPADVNAVTAWIARSTGSNAELLKLNDELEPHIGDIDFQKAFETMTEYKHEANTILGLLKARLSFLGLGDKLPLLGTPV